MSLPRQDTEGWWEQTLLFTHKALTWKKGLKEAVWALWEIPANFDLTAYSRCQPNKLNFHTVYTNRHYLTLYLSNVVRRNTDGKVGVGGEGRGPTKATQLRKPILPLTPQHPQISYQTGKSKSSHNYIDSPPELFSHVPIDKSNYLEINKVY